MLSFLATTPAPPSPPPPSPSRVSRYLSSSVGCSCSSSSVSDSVDSSSPSVAFLRKNFKSTASENHSTGFQDSFLQPSSSWQVKTTCITKTYFRFFCSVAFVERKARPVGSFRAVDFPPSDLFGAFFFGAAFFVGCFCFLFLAACMSAGQPRTFRLSQACKKHRVMGTF